MDLNSVWSAKDLVMAGLAYTVLGILVVFMILVIIMFAIKAMVVLSGSDKGAKKTAETPAETPAPAPVAAPAAKQEDGGELIAVITAAIAAMMGQKSTTGFCVRSYRRINDDEWNKASRRESLESRF